MSSRRAHVLAGTVAALVGTVLLGGCGGFGTAAAPGDTAVAGDNDGGTATQAASTQLGWATVDTPFAAPTPPGGAITGADSDTSGASPTGGADGGPVLVNLWASWCGPCRAELPKLEQYSRSAGVSVVGVSEDRTADDATTALTAAGVTYPSWLDDGDQSYLLALAQVVPQALPSSVLVVDGMVVAVHIGSFDSAAAFTPIARYVENASAPAG